MAATGIVGAQVPIATGLGFAHKHKKDGLIAICYLGDGARLTRAQGL